jgi:hypothetical protein
MNYCPYGLIKSCLTIFVISTLTFSGCLGGGECGVLNLLTSEKYVVSAKVFAAAPKSFSLIDPENLAFSNLNAPPPYSKVTSSKVFPSVFKPSSATLPCNMLLPMKLGCMGGTDGTALGVTPIWAKAGCTTVDVWLPDNRSINTAPTINDPNASITLDITPPSRCSQNKDSNCVIYRYHHGNPPPLMKRKKKFFGHSEAYKSHDRA